MKKFYISKLFVLILVAFVFNILPHQVFAVAPSGWTQQTNLGQHAWTSIASSSNGTKLAAVAVNDYIYTSSDSGVTWTPQTAGRLSIRKIPCTKTILRIYRAFSRGTP